MHKNKNNMRYWLYKTLSQFFNSSEVQAFVPGGSSYLVYTALISQADTDAPVVEQVFENTIGDIVWTRIDVGQYRGTLTGAFPEDKTFIPPFDVPYGYISVPISNNDPLDNFFVARRATDDYFSLEFNDLTYSSVEWSSVAFGMKLFFRIIVYP